MDKQIKIGSRTIGEDRPLFIVAEVGVTCNYDMGITKELIDVIAWAGADAIKFIFWFPEEYMSNKTTDYTYDTLSNNRPKNVNLLAKKELRSSLKDKYLDLLNSNSKFIKENKSFKNRDSIIKANNYYLDLVNNLK